MWPPKTKHIPPLLHMAVHELFVKPDLSLYYSPCKAVMSKYWCYSKMPWTWRCPWGCIKHKIKRSIRISQQHQQQPESPGVLSFCASLNLSQENTKCYDRHQWVGSTHWVMDHELFSWVNYRVSACKCPKRKAHCLWWSNHRVLTIFHFVFHQYPIALFSLRKQ